MMDDLAKFRSEAVDRLKKRFLGPDRGPLERDGCLRFLRIALAEAGIETTGDFKTDALQWRQVPGPAEPLDVAAFRWVTRDYHVALMVDRRRALQASDRTNGVALIEITREPWCNALKGFYRHKSFLRSPDEGSMFDPIEISNELNGVNY